MARLVLLAAAIPLIAGCSVLGGLSNPVLRFPGVMTVSSPVFSADVALPRLYTCHGAGVSPPLEWSGAPQGAKSFAIVVDDSLAPIEPYVYWIVFDINPSTIAIPQNGIPRGARVARNSMGRASYDPPCPVTGSHQYRFTVYALNVRTLAGPSGPLRSGAGLKAAWTAIAQHAIAVGRLTASARS